MPSQSRTEEPETTNFRDRVRPQGNEEIEHVHVGDVSASIFTRQGENGAFDTVEFQKSYKNKEGKREYTSNFKEGDLLQLAKCADKAHDRLMERRQERYQAQNQGQSR